LATIEIELESQRYRVFLKANLKYEGKNTRLWRIGKIKALPEPLAGGSGSFEPGNGLPGVGAWLLDWGLAWNAGGQRRISG
jgi:hypothetical protein